VDIIRPVEPDRRLGQAGHVDPFDLRRADRVATLSTMDHIVPAGHRLH
jgi:hypothetical protein